MRKIPALFIIILITTHCFAGEISYDEALSAMLSRNGNIQSSQLSVEQARYQKRSARGLYLPQITLDAKYTMMNDNLTMEMSLPGLGALSYQLQDQNFFRASANLTYPVFTGGKRIAANNAASAYYQNSLADYDILKNDLIYELTEKYFGLQLSMKASELYREVYENLRQHYEIALSKEKAGTIPKVERMHAEVSMNEARRNYNQSVIDVEIARVALANLLSATDEITPTTPLFIVSPTNVGELEYFLNAMENSPQILKLQNYQDLARAGLTEKRAAYMPDIFLYGSYEFYRDDLTMLDPDWYVGIGAQWKIFEGFSGHNNAIAASKAFQSVQLKKSQTQQDLNTLAEVQYKRMLKAYEGYTSAKDTLEFTEEFLRVRTKSFESGFGTSIDVVDAQTALSKNRLDVMFAAYEFDLALVKLLSIAGRAQDFERYKNNINAEIIK